MSVVKTMASFFGWLRALPHLVSYGVGAAVLGRAKAFTAASESIARIPGNLGVYARQAFYRRTLDHVGADVYCGFMSIFSKPQARLGDRVYIGRFCTIGWVEIGTGAMLADGVQVLSGRHQHGSGVRSEGLRLVGLKEEAAVAAAPSALTLQDNGVNFTQVKIGAGAWIGAGAIIMANVGEHAVVAAGAVVVKPVPAQARVGGVPAKMLSEE